LTEPARPETVSGRAAAGAECARGRVHSSGGHSSGHSNSDGATPGHLQRPGSTRVLERRADGGALRRSVLPGGLRVVTEEVPGSRSASVGLWVGVGSRDESSPLAGAAHYLEHLLFKGTDRRTAAQLAEEIDMVGGELNAFTAKEHTCYYAHVLDSDLALAVDVVTDVVLNAVCAPEHMELERGVVLGELAMRDEDPEDLVHDEFSAALHGDHPLGRPVLGSLESITGMDRAALYDFYRERYTPERMILAVAGNVSHADVVRLAGAAFDARLASSATPEAPREGRELLAGSRRLALSTQDSEQAHVMLGMPGLSRHDERRFALGVLNAALGGGMSSRLFQEVRERRGLAYSVYSSVSSYADAGIVSVYAGCHPDRLGTVVGVLRSVLSQVAAEGLTDAEVARGKGQLRGGLVLGLEDTGSRMIRAGKSELNYAKHWTVDEQLELIDAVTGEELAALAAELLGHPLSAAVVGPYAHANELPPELYEVIS
jgi:predicted Zn-dependent peptidase